MIDYSQIKEITTIVGTVGGWIAFGITFLIRSNKAAEQKAADIITTINTHISDINVKLDNHINSCNTDYKVLVNDVNNIKDNLSTKLDDIIYKLDK
jgi:hypothetical protein